MALESRNYNHSTHNQKLHQTVSLDFFRKKSTFPLCFHFTNSLHRDQPQGNFYLTPPASDLNFNPHAVGRDSLVYFILR